MSCCCGYVACDIIEVHQGSELQLELECRTAPPSDDPAAPASIPLDLTDAEGLFLMKENLVDTDEAAALTGTNANGKIVLHDPLNGKLSMVISAEDSEAITAQANGCPYHDYQAQFAVKLSTDQIIKSDEFVLRFYQGAVLTFV